MPRPLSIRPLDALLSAMSCLVLTASLAGCGGAGSTLPTKSSPSPAITVSVSGSGQVRLGSTDQITAKVSNASNSAVTWQVNGVAGGNSSVGTISTAGVYTPPAAIPSPNSVTITAVSVADASVSGSTSESILNPQPAISAASAVSTSGSSYLVDVTGSGFISGSSILVGGASLTTTVVSSSELQAAYTAPAGQTGSVTVAVANPAPGATTSASTVAVLQQNSATASAAARFLDQTSFGPTLTTIAQVQQVGLAAYLNQQLNTPQTVLPDIPNPYPSICTGASYPCAESEWWQTALTGSDQLRQRVALALSEIWVTSTATIPGEALTPYLNILAKDAFGNYRTLMEDVTLSPAMGQYLNLLNSNKPAAGQIANENYARELMQLFTLGENLLNQDGTLQTDAHGNPIPTYTEADIQGFARAYTGWTYANADGTAPSRFPNSTPAYDYPLQPVDANHDTNAKTILGGVVLPAGQTAKQDLDASLDTIFNHPNVGPFVCRQLIQHLVTGNPSSEYVGRVAAVFADNGSGVRGDMKSVITAILMDPEARANDDSPSAIDGGHLREPILYVTAIMRGLGFTATDPNAGSNYTYEMLWGTVTPLNQRPFHSPSVFNFFPPGYVIPGTTQNAPEFAMENTATVTLRQSLAESLVKNKISGQNVDLSATSSWGKLAANPTQLVNTLNTLFMHSQMPASMSTAIVNHISTLTDPAQRARVAIYLVITSSAYKVVN